MIPVTSSFEERLRTKYPLAEFSCRHLAYNKDYFVQDLTGVKRKTLVECTADNLKRNCEGKCPFFKRKSLLSRFLDLILSSTKTIPVK
jgi:hypothetical protein